MVLLILTVPVPLVPLVAYVVTCMVPSCTDSDNSRCMEYNKDEQTLTVNCMRRIKNRSPKQNGARLRALDRV